MDKPTGQLILTTTQAGKRVGRSSETIRRWAVEGQVRATRLGGRWWVDADSLADLERSDGARA